MFIEEGGTASGDVTCLDRITPLEVDEAVGVHGRAKISEISKARWREVRKSDEAIEASTVATQSKTKT